jgi:hypothetical protein
MENSPTQIADSHSGNKLPAVTEPDASLQHSQETTTRAHL